MTTKTKTIPTATPTATLAAPVTTEDIGMSLPVGSVVEGHFTPRGKEPKSKGKARPVQVAIMERTVGPKGGIRIDLEIRSVGKNPKALPVRITGLQLDRLSQGTQARIFQEGAKMHYLVFTQQNGTSVLVQ